MRNFCLVLFSVLLSITLVHSGRTDSNGGHWDHSTGEYHYHHGHPAHQHPNGICPYESKSETTSRYQSPSEPTVKKQPGKFAQFVSKFFQWCALIVLLFLQSLMFYPIFKWIADSIKKHFIRKAIKPPSGKDRRGKM